MPEEEGKDVSSTKANAENPEKIGHEVGIFGYSLKLFQFCEYFCA
jgi:hypothetical protein